MAYRLENFSDVPGELQRIATEQIDKAVSESGDPELPAAVHQVRKRCKKIRALLRLARGALEEGGIYRAENARFRDIARDLSVLRDAEVLIETHDTVTAELHNPDVRIECAAIRGRLVTRRHACAGRDTGMADRLQAARAGLLAGRDAVPDWAGRARSFPKLLPGLEETYRRGRRAMTTAYKSGSDEAFHELRKRVKYHWYACRLLRDLWPAEMDARRGELSRLSTLLGHEHDLSVYRATLEAHPEWFGLTTRLPDILAAADHRREALRDAAHPLAMRLYAEKPARLAARFRGYWRSWRAEKR